MKKFLLLLIATLVASAGIFGSIYTLYAGPSRQEVPLLFLFEVPGVNRVVYDISSKPPSTIEWE